MYAVIKLKRVTVFRFRDRGFIGAFIMQHSIYLGVLRMLLRSDLICLGRDSAIIWLGFLPALSLQLLFAPLSSNALTYLVDLEASTLLTAK